MDKLVIIIGFDHDNTLNVLRALGQEGFQSTLILISDTKKTFISKSKYAKIVYKVKSINDGLKCLNNLSITNTKIPVISTADSIAVAIDKEYPTLSQSFILPNCFGRSGGIITEMDKNRMVANAKSSGFCVPSSIKIKTSGFDISSIAHFCFPVIIKPDESFKGSKDDFRICNNKEEVQIAINSLKDQLESALIQEFIPNDEVILLAGVRKSDGSIYQYGHVNKVKHGSNSNNLGMNSWGYFSSEDILKQQCIIFLEKIGYFGPYSFEFIRHKDKLYFLEINLRTDGLFFFFTKAGINLPAIWADSNASAPANIKNKVIGMCEFQYLKNFVRVNRLFENLTDCLKTDIFSIASIKDPMPFIFKFLYH